ncbi:MAG: sigma-70 family RNA polymerase sigma factor [Bacteroidetes bacterium]|nr:sigma-70 family RNA polymerase sigma factor [Bacteroidota bacterium]
MKLYVNEYRKNKRKEMLNQSDIELSVKAEKSYAEKLFDEVFPQCFSIASRYTKSEYQSNELLNKALSACFKHYTHQKSDVFDHAFKLVFEELFISELTQLIKSINNEYFVASTVHFKGNTNEVNNYNLFEDTGIIDINDAPLEVIYKSLQQLVPAQRLVYNLYVIDGYSIEKISQLLDSSEQTLKSNLEKARYNFQINLEKNLRVFKNGQAL